MSETHDPWKAVGLELLKLKDTRTIEALLRVINEAQAAEATQHRQEIAAKDETIDGLRLVALGWEKQRDEARARLAAVEAERDRLQRVNECVYEVCGCGNMADAHCMICCRPLTEHRLIPTRELEEIQRRFALYAEDLAERDRLKAALSQITALDFEKVNGRHNFARLLENRARQLSPLPSPPTPGETR